MPHWLIKSAVQRFISLLPASHRWNELFQQHITRSIELTPERFEGRLEYCRMHLDHFLQLRPQYAKDFTVLELGTGWFPVVPMGLYLCGARQCWTYDIAPLLSRERITRMLGRFFDCQSTGKLGKLLPGLDPERLAQVKEAAPAASELEPAEFLKRFNIHVKVQDAQSTGLGAETVDLFLSTGVLEYIPRPVLKSMLEEFKRVGTARHVQSHYLNLVDQYHYFDKRISPLNFLRFTERQWKRYNSPLTWLNRMRISDYRALLKELNFTLKLEQNMNASDADLDRVPLAPEFQGYSREDLKVLTSWIVATPAGT